MADNIMERTCVGCMKKFHKSNLLKLVKPKNDKAFIDENQNGSGRGCYICCDTKCVDAAMKKKRLSRALRCDIDPLFYDDIKKYIISLNQDE